MLLKLVIQTVDRFGLKAHFLRKHLRSVGRFYNGLAKRDFQSEIAVKFRSRFEKNRNKLFTFLEYDGVPWNNNNAEHAIKALADLRNVIGGNEFGKGNSGVLDPPEYLSDLQMQGSRLSPVCTLGREGHRLVRQEIRTALMERVRPN
jgi:hypothetical protein